MGRAARGLADFACRVLHAALPPALKPWGRAIRCETAGIADDAEALRFALDSLLRLVPRALAARLSHALAPPADEALFRPGGSPLMTAQPARPAHPRRIGIACAAAAVALGLAYLAAAGAPARYLATNAAALAIGLAALALFGRVARPGPHATGAALATLAAALLATALLGDPAAGAARWLWFAGLSIQPSLILLPVMIVGFAHSRGRVATAAMALAAAALALQPDRAMAGMLAAGLASLALMRPDRWVLAALGAALAGFAVTLARADTLPAVAYVDRIVYSSFDVHPLAGAAVATGLLLLLVPAVLGWRSDPAGRPVYAAFGTLWLAAILAAALGNYPTPIVGYGSSAIIGYALSLLALPRRVGESAGAQAARPGAAAAPRDRQLRGALA